jgi:hypothetical protein
MPQLAHQSHNHHQQHNRRAAVNKPRSHSSKRSSKVKTIKMEKTINQMARVNSIMHKSSELALKEKEMKSLSINDLIFYSGKSTWHILCICNHMSFFFVIRIFNRQLEEKSQVVLSFIV